MQWRRTIRNVGLFILVLALVVTAQAVYTPTDTELAVMAPAQTQGTPVPVLMYHHLLFDHNRWGSWIVSPDLLESDLQYIRDHGYTTMLISELIEALEGKRPMPEKPIILTFDDGHESVLAYGLPLLEEYGMKAEINIVGSYTDVFSAIEEHNIAYSYIQWQQMAAMAETGLIEFGNHSYDLHTHGDRYGVAIKDGEPLEAYREVLRADTIRTHEELTEALGGQEPFIYAFPLGKHCQEAKDLLLEMGYTVFLTCEEKVNYLQTYTPGMSLCRFNRDAGQSSAEVFSKFA